MSILQYFRPLLSCQLSLRPLFCLFLNDRFKQFILYLEPVGANNLLVSVKASLIALSILGDVVFKADVAVWMSLLTWFSSACIV